MHVLLASVSAATSPSGVCRHAANIARGMLAFPQVQKVTMLTGKWQAEYFRDAFGLRDDRLEIRSVPIANRSSSRNLWYLRGLPVMVRECGADVVHLAFPMPLRRFAYIVPAIVSLHDLYPFDMPQNFGKNRAWLNRAALRLCLRNVDAVACVSEATRTRAHQLFPSLDSNKTEVVPNSISLSREFRYVPLPEEIRDCPFLLCVAQHRANKNLQLLLRSFRFALDRNILPTRTKLVIVGNEGPETPLLRELISEGDLEERVLFLQGIADTLLLSLYAHCELVVAPSLLEGFGLPVAEALAAGSRVVCSDIPAFRSIGSAGCVFFEPRDNRGESLVAALGKAMQAPRVAAPRQAGLDPQQAAAMYLALYSKVLLQKQANVFQPSPADLSVSGDL
jgi:glycosyltransferase involved in cell wall biosynthesis